MVSPVQRRAPKRRIGATRLGQGVNNSFTDDRVGLHDDKARPFQVLHQALGDDRRYEFICVVDALAPIANARRMGSRLFTASLTITRKWDYLRAAWEDDRPWPTPRAPSVDVVP